MMNHDHDRDEHPDLADLDALRTGEADGAIREHVDGCARCAETLAALEDDARTWASRLGNADLDAPEETDRKALDAILVEASRIRRTSRRTGLLIRISAAAAAVLLFGVGLSMIGEPRDDAGVPVIDSVGRLDVDGSGAVDIVDAYHVARRLRRDEDAPAAWDVNDDGAVNDDDVRTIAMRAVTVSRSE